MAAWEYFTNQKQWEAYLKDLIRTNESACKQAIVVIYDRQTQEEKNKGESIEDNGIGFSKIDAQVMGEIAKKIKAGKELSKGEIAKSRNKMQKYWKQLMIISKEKAEAKQKEKEQKLAAQEIEDSEEIVKLNHEKLELFREHNEILRKCSEEGISCEYGICDECPITTCFQMRLNLGGKYDD